MQEIFVIISVGIMYCFWKTTSIKLQKMLLAIYGIGAIAFSAYAGLDADIVLAFLVFLNGLMFSIIISGLGVAEGITGLSFVYLCYRIMSVDKLRYTGLVLWMYLTLIIVCVMYAAKNNNSIKLVKTLKNDITAKEYSSHKAVNMEVGDEAKVIEELRPLGKIQNDSEIVQARKITGKLVKTSTRVTVVGIMGNTALVTVKKDDGNSKEI